MSKRTFYKQSTKVDANSTATVLEVEKPVKFIKSTPKFFYLPKPNPWHWLISIGALAGLLSVMGIIILGITWYIKNFEAAAKIKLSPLVQSVWSQRTKDVFDGNNQISFLLLGLDQSINQRETSILTDTILLATLRKDGLIRVVSIPRDLWISSLKTKINALYYYGIQNNPDDGVTLLTSVITEITGVPINYYVMINMDSIKQGIDAMGGITVDVARSFEDNLYPREVDITSTDPEVLYETVTFQAGKQTFNGTDALKFIRSRHSTDLVEGTDQAREQRQQRVLSALFSKLGEITWISDPTMVGNLYHVWRQYTKTNLNDPDLALLALRLSKSNIRFEEFTIPMKTETQDGLIYHPQNGPAKQWVYLPVDESFSTLKKWIQDRIWQ